MKEFDLQNRKENEPPLVTSKFGWRFHHLGIPTSEIRKGEKYLKKYKMYVSGFEESPFGIEWMRFESDSPISPLIQKVPHLAFEVDDIEEALKNKKVLSGINSPSSGVKVAMILDNGAPVELLEFTESNSSQTTIINEFTLKTGLVLSFRSRLVGREISYH